MVPREIGERAREIEAADGDVDERGVKGLLHHFAKEICRGGREFGGLDDHAISSGEHFDHRADGEIERKIPGHDIADDALRLTLEVGLRGAHHCRVDFARRGAHPLLKLAQNVLRSSDWAQHFDEVRGRYGMAAEVFTERGTDAFAIGEQHADELADAGLALVEVGIPVGVEGGALRGECGFERGNRRVVVRGRRRKLLGLGAQDGHFVTSQQVVCRRLDQFEENGRGVEI